MTFTCTSSPCLKTPTPSNQLTFPHIPSFTLAPEAAAAAAVVVAVASGAQRRICCLENTSVCVCVCFCMCTPPQIVRQARAKSRQSCVSNPSTRGASHKPNSSPHPPQGPSSLKEHSSKLTNYMHTRTQSHVQWHKYIYIY